jgi:hypothetical protein
MASCIAALCPCQDLTLKTQLEAVNGKKMPALEVFAHALRFFKEHALQVCHGPHSCLLMQGLPPSSFLSPHLIPGPSDEYSYRWSYRPPSLVPCLPVW